MPEHRRGTPPRLADLESFLWHDFEAGLADWTAWLARKMPNFSHSTSKSAFGRVMQLHGSLRALQADNSGVSRDNRVNGGATLNRLIVHYHIRPNLAEDGQIFLTTPSAEDPGARLLLMALEAMRSNIWRRFKLCRDPTCRASFYDASKAAAKTWCSMQVCGSRNKMRRYRRTL